MPAKKLCWKQANLFSSHYARLIGRTLEENIEISKKPCPHEQNGYDPRNWTRYYRWRRRWCGQQWCGQQSGFYTQPEDVYYAYSELSKVSLNFTVAASGLVMCTVFTNPEMWTEPKILKNSQEYIKSQRWFERWYAGKVLISRRFRFVARRNSVETIGYGGGEHRDIDTSGLIRDSCIRRFAKSSVITCRDKSEGWKLKQKIPNDPRVWIQRWGADWFKRLQVAFIWRIWMLIQ